MISAFQYIRRATTDVAAIAVEHVWGLEAATCSPVVEASLPDGCVEVFFNLGPTGRHLYDPTAPHRDLPRRRAWVIGPHSAPLLVAKEVRDSCIIGVRLYAGVARRVLGMPVSRLTAQLVDLEDLWGAEARAVHERIGEARDLEQRIVVAQCEFERRLRAARIEMDLVRDRRTCEAVIRLQTASIAAAADALGLSHRQLIAWFDDHVGLKPKVFQRVRRLRDVLHEVHRGRIASCASIASRAGYFDQAHFTREFQRLTGFTPSAYERERRSAGIGWAAWRGALATCMRVRGVICERLLSTSTRA
jgi:AraC-like DNA-binding protein